MKYLTGDEDIVAREYMDIAAMIAVNSTCHRSKCGSIIVNHDEIIGTGYNSPPGGITLDECIKEILPADFRSDRTCCVHAEERAILEAIAKNKDKIIDSRLYFIRLDERNNKIPSGEPYCTICSKLALDVGIGEFVLWRERGIAVYNTKEYNDLSFGLK